MKSIKLIIGIIVAVIVLSSCTKRACPTYSNSSKPKQHSGSTVCATTKVNKFDKTFNY